MNGLYISLLVLAVVLVLLFVIVRAVNPRMLLQQMIMSRAPLPESAPESNAAIEAAPPYKLVQARYGLMLANPNDIYLGRAIIEYGEYAEKERQFLHSLLSLRPGKVVEIGANVGTHTIPLARALATGQRDLIAFEPQQFLFQNLCANLALNGITNVQAWPWACGAKAETVYFDAQNYSSESNFGSVSMTTQAKPNTISVPCVRLDDVIGNETISLLKIDVEGFELLVLQGAVNILGKSRPILYVENDRIEKSKALIEWLWSQNYRLWWHVPPLFNPDNFFGNETNAYGEICSINMLGLPRELEVPVDSMVEVTNASFHPTQK